MGYFLDQAGIASLSFSLIALIYLIHWEFSMILAFYNFCRFFGIPINICSCWRMTKRARKSRVKYERHLKVTAVPNCGRLYTTNFPKDLLPSPIEIMLSIRAASHRAMRLQGYKDFNSKYGDTAREVLRLDEYIPRRRAADIIGPQLNMLAVIMLVNSKVLKQFGIPELESVHVDPTKRVLVLLKECFNKYKKELIEFANSDVGKSCISVDSWGNLHVDINIEGTISRGANEKQSLANLICVLSRHYQIFDRVPEAGINDLAKAAYQLFDIPWNRPKADEFYKAIRRVEENQQEVLDILKALPFVKI